MQIVRDEQSGTRTLRSGNNSQRVPNTADAPSNSDVSDDEDSSDNRQIVPRTRSHRKVQPRPDSSQPAILRRSRSASDSPSEGSNVSHPDANPPSHPPSHSMFRTRSQEKIVFRHEAPEVTETESHKPVLQYQEVGNRNTDHELPKIHQLRSRGPVNTVPIDTSKKQSTQSKVQLQTLMTGASPPMSPMTSAGASPVGYTTESDLICRMCWGTMPVEAETIRLSANCRHKFHLECLGRLLLSRACSKKCGRCFKDISPEEMLEIANQNEIRIRELRRKRRKTSATTE